MESLFVRQTPKRGRVCLMLGASLLLHGGIIGLAALWTEPQPADGTVPMHFFDPPPEGPNALPPSLPPDNADEPTPTPQTDEAPVPTPPLSLEDPEIAESSPAPPPRKLAATRQVVAPRSSHPATSTNPASNQPNGSGLGNSTGAVPAANAKAWVMPPPPYPRQILALHVTGATTVRITTNAAGQVSNVVIVQSAGNPALDSQTENYVRMNWHGPPNASRTTQFVYQIK